MDPQNPTPGVTTPPVEPAAPAAPAPTEPTGSEPVINTGDTKDQAVPFTRFQEVNDKAKAEEERASRLERELEDLKAQQPQTPQNDDEDIEPDTLELIKKSASKLGLVSKEELDAREATIQVKQDLNELTSHYKDSSVPFDGKKVIDYAKANGMPLGSKKSLDAVYKEMNYDAIIEAQRKAAIADFQQGSKSGGEKPGSQGPQAPKEQTPGTLKERIAAAREKTGFAVK